MVRGHVSGSSNVQTSLVSGQIMPPAIQNVLDGKGFKFGSLAEGLQDHLISVAIGESLETGRDVTTTTEAWAS